MTAPLISAVPQENMASTNASAELRTRQGSRASPDVPSLPEAFRSVPVYSGASVWRKLLAFAGPGYLVAVGYMDPGNWATDLGDRKSTRLNSSHLVISYAVFCLKKKKNTDTVTAAPTPETTAT